MELLDPDPFSAYPFPEITRFAHEFPELIQYAEGRALALSADSSHDQGRPLPRLGVRDAHATADAYARIAAALKALHADPVQALETANAQEGFWSDAVIAAIELIVSDGPFVDDVLRLSVHGAALGPPPDPRTVELAEHARRRRLEGTALSEEDDPDELADLECRAEDEVERYAAARAEFAWVPLDPILSAPSRRPGCATRRTGTRQRGAGRPAGRGGSRRSSAASGDSGDSDPGEPEPPSLGRLCACGCGEPVKDPSDPRCRYAADARGKTDSHRQEARRKRQVAEDPDVAPVLERCESCNAFLSRFGKGGARCWTCAYAKTTDPEDPDLDEVLYGLGRLDPLAETLIRCGGWPSSSTRTRSLVIATAWALGIPLRDTQAGALIEGFGSREAARDVLAAMAGEKRRRPVEPPPEKWTPLVIACEDCARPWLSDLDPAAHRCPNCGGPVQSRSRRLEAAENVEADPRWRTEDAARAWPTIGPPPAVRIPEAVAA